MKKLPSCFVEIMDNDVVYEMDCSKCKLMKECIEAYNDRVYHIDLDEWEDEEEPY